MSLLYNDYLIAVREAITQKPDDWTFKSDPRYKTVLEHTSREHGQALLEWSLRQQVDYGIDVIRDLAQRNDSVGCPLLAKFDGVGFYSPANWRYLCHALKLLQHIKTLNVPAVDIVELGGGYGGLALWVRGLAYLFKTRVDLYYIVDLPEVAELQSKVLRALGVPEVYMLDGTYEPNFGVFTNRSIPLVCVSNYAFSEFTQDVRDWYAEKLLKHCRHGLMVWNFPQAIKDGNGVVFGGPPYQFVEWPITRELDEPNLFGDHEVVTW